MAAYYNENNAYCAQWLRNLIKAGLIADGDVDDRDIREVEPGDIDGYTQCHFFAGIGGWSYALRLAGIGDNERIWTGSCPCQPFSVAGRGAGAHDKRHLWPAFRRFVSQLCPSTVFGEQVASKDGRLWLSGVRADLEAMGYAVGAADLCAAGIGAPHIRQRLYWVANNIGKRGKGQSQADRIGEMRQGWTCSQADLLGIRNSPFMGQPGIPQPLLRSVDDGFPDGVAGLHGYGNAIHPGLAAEFMKAYMER